LHQLLDWQSKPETLISDSAVNETVAQHYFATLQSRSDYFRYMFGSVSEKQESFRPRSSFIGCHQELFDESSVWLGCQQDRQALSSEMVCNQIRNSRFPTAVDAFKGDEETVHSVRPPCTFLVRMKFCHCEIFNS
jgi:hypothetical protein